MHIITGEIRKEPRVKQMPNGSTLYVVELSERYKDKDGNWQYTNYSFFLMRKQKVLRVGMMRRSGWQGYFCILHIITGEIRKEPRVKQMPNGSTLYVVELSERYKDKDGNWQYTNYSFFLMRKQKVLRVGMMRRSGWQGYFCIL
ncbi:UNVERIFIED_ASMBLY: single-stranded DNA binding protein [Shigella phage 2019SD1]|uniref:Single-stranded DNA binding protein n=1 Tax=Shigella phage 2019SD1 TaxID=2848074 RepID=A0A6M5CAT6_9CAUD|nr:single-stranded DNA binding protein [Shigella phage 2019SD1]